MDALVMVSSGYRRSAYLHMDFPCTHAGDFDTQLLEEFFLAFSIHSGITLHIRVIYGRNTTT